MIDIQQLTSLISAFRVETEKESISPETVGSILQSIADLLATATSETEYNIIRFWKETLQHYRFLYDIQQRNVDDHSNVILQLMARSMVDGATSSLTLAIGPATRTRAGVLTAEDYSMEIELPFADCPQNLDIFGMITRMDVDTGDIFFDSAQK
ncbi:MAG: hypothetical protein IJK41_00880 [Muribaculaceae bacterium]|nr:hypothetical protein [Muribaculaceae bacterium]